MKKKEIKILLVDDEPDILEIVGYNLSAEGYQVITADNGEKAVKKQKKKCKKTNVFLHYAKNVCFLHYFCFFNCPRWRCRDP